MRNLYIRSTVILLVLLLTTPCMADDYWVYIRTYDRSGVTAEDDKGRSKKGDIVQMMKVVPGQEPTKKAQKEWKIIKVSGLTKDDVKKYMQPRRTSIDEYTAYRKYKMDVNSLGYTAPGIEKTAVDFKTTIEPKLSEKTALDLFVYEQKRKFYAYVQRPLIQLANKIVPFAHAADNTSKICAVGANCTDEDYNTLTAWEDANDGDLVTATTRQIAELYNDDGDIDDGNTDGTTIDGSTTNSDYYMMVTAPSAERHDGTDNDAATITASLDGDWGAVVYLADDYTVVEWLIIIPDFTDDTRIDDTGGLDLREDYVVGRNNVIHPNAIGNLDAYSDRNVGIRIKAYTTAHQYAYNNFIYGFAGGGGGDNGGIYATTDNGENQYIYLYNNTIIDGDDGIIVLSGGATGTAEADIRNNIAAGNSVADYDTSSTNFDSYTEDYNCSEDGSESGGNSLATCDDDTDFTSATDLHLVVGAPAIDEGVDLSGTFTDDIDGVTRSGTWDMGADEYVAAAGGDRRTLLVRRDHAKR